MERPLVQILVEVANIEAESFRAEVEKVSLGTAIV